MATSVQGAGGSSPSWAALEIVGLTIFAVILVKQAVDVAKGQGWIQ